MDFGEILYYSATPIFLILFVFLVILLIKIIKGNKNR